MKHLWAVDFTGNFVPEPRLCPDFHEAQGVDLVVGDTHFAVVAGKNSAVENAIRDFPYWKNAGHPSDGRWVDSGGSEFYIANGNIVDSEQELWEAMGHTPADFGGDTWDDVDDDVVRDVVPTF